MKGPGQVLPGRGLTNAKVGTIMITSKMNKLRRGWSKAAEVGRNHISHSPGKGVRKPVEKKCKTERSELCANKAILAVV